MAHPTEATHSLPHAVAEKPMPWVRWIPDGAISLETENAGLVLRASNALQDRFEHLLAGRKTGTLTPEETQEYEAICDLDDALSWLNRLARTGRHG